MAGAASNAAQVHACVGGTAVRDDIRTLQNGVHIVVGTPGRAYDMISRGALRLDRVGLFVLDEADEMLSRGFKDQIYDVFQYLPERVQVMQALFLFGEGLAVNLGMSRRVMRARLVPRRGEIMFHLRFFSTSAVQHS